MKYKLSFFIICIVAISFFITMETHSAEKKVDSDFQLRKILIGKWKSDINEDGIEIKSTDTYTAEGEILKRGNLHISAMDQKIDFEIMGTWIIKNGVLIITCTKTNIPEAVPIGTVTKDTILILNNKIFKSRTEKGNVYTDYRIVPD